ncbi:TPA: peptide ABC transporter substrate-binding protein [Streptococcus agalactiae]|nr:peptide ABC transporter substrate-binding protein [Streptococcus agalactiae]
MKNKGLIATLILLTILVVGELFYNKSEKHLNLSEKQVVKIGILQYVTHDALDAIEKGVEDGLAQEGYKGKKVKLTVLNAEADQSKIQAMSKQLVNHHNDILIGIATPSAQGLAASTKDTPIIMGAVSDPLGAKLVTNMKKPTTNVTGLSNVVPTKQTVQLIKDITPNVKRIGILYASSEDNSVSQVTEFTKYAQKAGLEVLKYSVPSTNEIKTSMSVMTKKVDAVFVPQDNTIASAFRTVIVAANQANIPVYSSVDTMVEQGSIASVAQSQYGLGLETAKQAIKVLRGKPVKDVPVKVIDTGKPSLNLKAAKHLGIKIPKKIMKQAIKVLRGKPVKDVPVKVIDTGKPSLNLKAAKHLGIKIPKKIMKQAEITVKVDD